MQANRSIMPLWALLMLCHGVHAKPITGWAASLGTPPLTGANTASPVIGDNTPSSAAHVAIYAPFEILSLVNPGDKITLSGSVELRGIVAGDTQFRWGIFDSNKQSGAEGWKGYFVGNCAVDAPGIIRKRATGSYVLNEGSVALKPSAIEGIFAIANGNYQFTLSYERLRNGSIDIVWKLTSGASETFTGTANDPNPATYNFDRIGFLSGRNMAADQLRFQKIDVSLQTIKKRE